MSLARTLSKLANVFGFSGSNVTLNKELVGPKGVARAWVVFDATRNAAGGSDTANTARYLIASYNVTSVTKSSTGLHVVNIPSGILADGNYCAVGTGRGNALVALDVTTAPTATTCTVTTRVNTTGAQNDAPYNSVVIFD
jgi:hypothetical protein